MDLNRRSLRIFIMGRRRIKNTNSWSRRKGSSKETKASL